MKKIFQTATASFRRNSKSALLFSGLLCIAGWSASAQLPTKVLQFDFNEPTGSTTVTDAVSLASQPANPTYLKLFNTPGGSLSDIHGYGYGPVGTDNCLDFSLDGGSFGFGAPIAYKTGITTPNLQTVTNFTISMWVNPLNNNVYSGVNPRVFVMGPNGSAADVNTANSLGWKGNGGSGQTYIGGYNGQTSGNLYFLPLNAWTFVTLTYSNGAWAFYAGSTQNQMVLEGSETDPFTAANLGGNFTLALGNYANGSTSRGWASLMAHVNFYLGSASPDYAEYIRESYWPLGSLAWITAPLGTNINFAYTGLLLANNQNLTGRGAVVGNVTNSAGSQILPGYGSKIGTLTFSNTLNLVDGGQLGYYLGNPSDKIVVNGNLSASGITSINIGNVPSAGTYTLLTVSNTFGATAANFQVVSNSNLSGKTASLSVSGKSLLLTIAGARPPANLAWVGDTANGAANAWDIITSSNWWNSTHLDLYYDGDTVNFTDTGTNLSGTINEPTLDVTVNPAAVHFNTTNAYTLTTSTGAGSVAGSCQLTLSGSGSLALGTANSFSGGTVVNGGILQLANSGALGNPTAAILTVTNGASVDLNGYSIGNTPANPVVIGGLGIATNQGAVSSSVGMSNPLNANPVCIRSLQLAGDAAIGNDDNTWQLGPDRGAINLTGGYLDGQGHNLTKIGDNTVIFEVRNVSPLSQLTLANGGIVYANTGVGSSIGATAAIVISNNAFLSSYNHNEVPGAPNGNVFSNNITIGPGGGQLLNNLSASDNGNTACQDVYYGRVVLNDTLTIVNGNYNNNVYSTLTFNAPISGTGSVVCEGPVNPVGNSQNTVIFNGANTYSGSTMVTNFETLEISTANQSGGAYVAVDGGVLDVVQAGNAATLPMSSLLLDQENIEAGSLSISRATYLSPTTPLIYATNLVINSGVILPPANFYQNGQFPLIKYSGTLGGTGGNGYANLSFGPLPSTLTGSIGMSLVNNTVNNSIDLLVSGATVNTNAATVNFQAVKSGGALQFSWAGDHVGWQLYSNSVSVNASGSWFPVSGTANGNTATIPINPAKANVFFQLRYP